MATYMNQTNSGRIIVQQSSPSAIIVQPDNERKIILKGTGGLKGEKGDAATITVGSTTTGESGTQASVVNSGTSTDAVLDFTIPKGSKGDKGDKGDTGTAATVSAGTTTTLPAGSSASVTNSGTSSVAIFDFSIPKGDKGDKGDTGAAGSAATISAGTTTTLPAGSSASVTNSGTSSAAVFDFSIPKGDKGDKGDTGATGSAATIAVGTTSTLTPGSSATVTNSGTSSAAVFDFGIPKGEKGDTGATGPANTLSIGTVQGGATAAATITGTAPNQTLNLTLPKGDKGDTGATGSTGPAGADGYSPTATVSKAGDTATITITDKNGTTTASVTDGADGAAGAAATVAVGTTSTLPTGSSATVTNSGTSSAAVFNFGIPKGDKGDTGSQGPAGQGVVTGGTTGQVLAKKSNTNYDTEWVTPTSYSDFTGATSSVAGAHGLVPAPTTSDPDKFLKGDGTWGTPPGTNYTAGEGIEINSNTIAAKVRKVYNYYTARPATADTTATGNGGLYTFQATGSMTTGKPKSDSHIVNLDWDNANGWDSQLAVSTYQSGSTPWLGIRTQNSGAWESWVYMLTDTANAVKTANIDALAVTTAKVADGAITEAKIDATAWAKKVNVASIDLTGQTTTLLALTKALGSAGTDYARWESRTDGGSSNISDKPTGNTNASFVCEARCSRWAANVDYRYQLICWVQQDTNPYVAYVADSSSNITWSRLKPTVNDATLTIQKNGTDVQTFTANSNTNKTANITVPTKTSDLTNDGSDNTSVYVEADELATVATSGSYADLSGTPTIPTVNDATLTLTQGGSTLGTFTANASSNVTIDVPGGGGAPTGAITMFAGSTAPTGYLICDGSAISRTTYADLFTVIGTTYGTGDGSTTFNLPNLKGKVPVGQDTSDTSFDVLGETGGEKTHTLVKNELPKIDAYFTVHGAEHGTNIYKINGNSSKGTYIGNKYMSSSGASGAYSYNDFGIAFGNDQAHNNLQPYIVLNYIIKY